MHYTFALAAALAATVLVSSADAQVNPPAIRFGYGLSTESVQGRAARFFASEVDRLSAGKLKVSTFGDATMGSDMQMQNALLAGSLEMMVGSTATLVSINKDFGVYDLPFLISTNQEADGVLDGPLGTKLAKTLEPAGLIVLCYWENGFRNLTNNKHPVAKLEDFSGIKLRVMQNPVYLSLFNALGANAVPLPYSELFTAMQSGVVDGQENPVTTIASDKFYEVQKYLSITRHVYTPWIMMAAKPWWDKLTDDQKKIIQQAAVASRDFERKDSREGSLKAVDFLKSKGMQVNEVSKEELARMQEKAKPAFDKFVSDGSGQVLADIQAELAKMRK
jgi:tripartite ATP-independent transporter DctP family solute receptor